MKISTLRALLVVADVLAVLAVGLVVFQALSDKKARDAENNAYRTRVIDRIAAVQPDRPEASRGRSDTGRHLDLNLANFTPPPPPPPTPTGPTTTQPEAEQKAPPLAEKITLVGLQSGQSDEVSLVLYTRSDDEAVAASPTIQPSSVNRGGRGRPQPIRGRPSGSRTPAVAAGPTKPLHVVYRGEAIEIGSFFAVVTAIDPRAGTVTFDYDGNEVVIELPEAPPTAGATSAVAGGGASEESAPVTDNQGEWIIFTPSKPSDIKLTASGVASMKAKGSDAVLEGVRWSTEEVPDRGKMRKAVQVSAVPPGSVLAKGGLKPGDSILSVNGVDVSSRGDIVNYVRGNPNLPNYTVRILSRGRVVTRTVSRP